MSDHELKTRECGAVHPAAGEVCTRNVLVEPGCCHEKVYNHEGPHVVIKDGKCIHKWEAVLVVKDLPFDAYEWEEPSA